MLTYYLTSLGVIPYFTSRAFLPLFATAAIGRFGPGFAPLADVAGVQLLAAMPTWATSGTALLVLGALAFFEVVVGKIPEARELLTLSDAQVKAVGAFLLCFAIVRGNPMDLVNHVMEEGVSTSFASGGSFAYVWSFIIGSIVWLGSVARNVLFGTLMDLDPDDDLGVQGLLSWIEDAIGFGGVLFVVVFPILALIVVALTLGGLWLVQRILRRREARAKIECPDCATPCPPCGPRCPSCQSHRSPVAAVGVLGVVKSTLAPDPASHRLALLSRKRCAFCGERLDARRLDQSCTACGIEAFESRQALEHYLARLRASLPKTLAILAAMSLVPVVGLVAGVIYYRLSLISSLRCYLPRSTGFLARWIVRIVNLFLLMIQPVPILGMLALPAMCLVNFTIYQGLLRRQASGVWVGQLAPA